jgi:uncharacterized protein (TIGR02611 family)
MSAKADEDPVPSGVLAKIRATPTGRLTLKIGIGVLGGLVVALGVVLIPFPGPGWAIVILGLAIWALEFAWAKHLLDFTRHHVQTWTRWAARQTLPTRAVIGALSLIFVGAVVWGSVKLSFDIDLIKVTRNWVTPD